MNPGRELERARPRSMRPTCDGSMPLSSQNMNRHLLGGPRERSQAYQLLGELGRGSFGVTYKAQNVRSKENVAIKDVRVSQGSSSSLLRKEGQILKTLNHLNIVNLVSLWNRGSGDNECPALVLELCLCNLTDLLKQHGDKIMVGHVKCLALDLMEGLRYIHSQRVIHRDIKPDNILLTGNGLLKICDFGLATFMRENHDGQCYSPGVGSKNYMAPELLLESTRYNWAVDIWAAGCTIAELISCERFFGGSSKWEMSELQQFEDGNSLESETETIKLAQMILLLGTIDRTTLPQRLDLPLLDHHTLPRNDELRMDYELTLTTSDHAARNLLKNLLQLNPDSRLSASAALAHDFFLCDPRPERLLLVADYTDQHGVQVSSSASTVAPSSLQVEGCHNVSASDNSVGERIPQDISPPAMQNNNEAGNEFNPICISSESESANFDTNLML